MQVIYNLRIAHIEIRAEDDPEVAPYRHERQIETILCPQGTFHGVAGLKKQVNDLLTAPMQRLHEHGIIACSQAHLLNVFMLNEADR